MIAFVTGKVSAVFVDSAVVDVGGVGIQVMCTPASSGSAGRARRRTAPSTPSPLRRQRAPRTSGACCVPRCAR